ncbi:hypothetical protein XENTR_v10000298 [Xenopus tropicalis]|nr:hypothetical protein XENTR_v10000298 [Xenopus tropicalis]
MQNVWDLGLSSAGFLILLPRGRPHLPPPATNPGPSIVGGNARKQWRLTLWRSKLLKEPLSGKPQVPSILDNRSHTCTSKQLPK